MPLFLVSYDLDQPGPQDYDKIIAELKERGGKEVLESTWIIASDLTASQLRDELRRFINGTTDRLLICPLRGWASWRTKFKISQFQ